MTLFADVVLTLFIFSSIIFATIFFTEDEELKFALNWIAGLLFTLTAVAGTIFAALFITRNCTCF